MTKFVDLRILAVKTLGQVFSEKKPLDECLPAKHPERDWLLEITAGTLRYWGRIELILEQHALKKVPTGAVRRALSTGIYQLLAQDRSVPAIIVQETVEAIKRKEGLEPSRFANALLRRVLERLDEWKTLRFPENESQKTRAQWASLPEWLYRRLCADYGEVWVKSWAESQLERPEIWLRSPTPLEFEKGPLEGSYRITSRLREARPLLERGEALVQDISSQFLISKWSERARSVFAERQPGEIRVLDACASPGGKTVGLIWNGFTVEASDQSGARLELLRQNIDRVAGGRAAIVEDWERTAPQNYDWVWIDAPCTSLGLIRRHPEVRWIKTEADVSALARVQSQLIESGFKHVRSGGILTYSVCSILKQEGEAHARVLRDRGVSVEILNVEPFDNRMGDGFQGFLAQKSLT